MLRVAHRAALDRQCFYYGAKSVPSAYVHQRRMFINIPTVLVPPVIFGGLFIGLWTWKCLMMIIFQTKIIYMPSLPPNSRWETIADYKNQCGGIEWKEERIRASDGTRISLCVASVQSGPISRATKKVYVLYFQGHSSSLFACS